MTSMLSRILLFLFPFMACAWILPTTRTSSSNTLSFRHSPSSQFMAKSVDKDSAMVDFMNQPPVRKEQTTTTTTTTTKPLDTDVLDMVYTIVKAADGRKADEIVALHVEACTSLCSCIVILSGNSRPQNQAIAKAIQEDMMNNNNNVMAPQVLPEGTADSGWMLLDYGSVMVHIMTPKSRLYYNLQGQWMEKGGTHISLQHLLLPNTGKSTSTSTNSGGTTNNMEQVSQQDDPFWS